MVPFTSELESVKKVFNYRSTSLHFSLMSVNLLCDLEAKELYHCKLIFPGAADCPIFSQWLYLLSLLIPLLL